MKIALLLIFAFLLFPSLSFAHSGGTDASGGHYCWTDCEARGLVYGEYHYHDEDDNPIQTYDNNEDVFDRSIAERLHGRILLQVEEHGEAWYIRSSDSMRYYMKDGEVAYEMMRYFSLGITDVDLATIPSVVDTTEMNASTSICSTNALADRLKGEILLQVEQHGEAWYVDPEKCRAIYMKDGAAAYEIMRYLGLGITNADLNMIPTGLIELDTSTYSDYSFWDFYTYPYIELSFEFPSTYETAGPFLREGSDPQKSILMFFEQGSKPDDSTLDQNWQNGFASGDVWILWHQDEIEPEALSQYYVNGEEITYGATTGTEFTRVGPASVTSFIFYAGGYAFEVVDPYNSGGDNFPEEDWGHMLETLSIQFIEEDPLN